MGKGLQLTDVWLKKEYHRLNRRWFGGALPKDTELCWFRSKIAYGKTGSYRELGTKKGSRIVGFRISISRKAERAGMATVMITMFHEMAHVATWGKCRAPHGRVWVAEMRRLAAAGAFDRIW